MLQNDVSRKCVLFQAYIYIIIYTVAKYVGNSAIIFIYIIYIGNTVSNFSPKLMFYLTREFLECFLRVTTMSR